MLAVEEDEEALLEEEGVEEETGLKRSAVEGEMAELERRLV